MVPDYQIQKHIQSNLIVTISQRQTNAFKSQHNAPVCHTASAQLQVLEIRLKSSSVYSWGENGFKWIFRQGNNEVRFAGPLRKGGAHGGEQEGSSFP